MFLRVDLGNIVIVEKQRRMCRLFQFSAEYDFLSLFATIWIESCFLLKGSIIDFFRSLLNSTADVFISCTTENRKVSSTNNLAFDDKPSDKSLIQIKKSSEIVQGVKYVQNETIKTPERRHWCRSGVFIVNFEHITHLVLVFLLLTLSR